MGKIQIMACNCLFILGTAKRMPDWRDLAIRQSGIPLINSLTQHNAVVGHLFAADLLEFAEQPLHGKILLTILVDL
jgi:hypothetical protein